MITPILSAFLVVTLVGLIAGVLLALASYFLYVKEDETALKIRECLPGVNCGACGFTGCDDYAKAVAEKRAEANLCIPGADKTAADICCILGIEAKDVVEMIAFVGCNGTKSATSKSFIYNGVKTCNAQTMIYAGSNECKFGCLGCGDCANVCPTNAICIKDGIAHVKSNICIGCGLCAKTCPKHIIKLIPQTAKVAVMCNNNEKGGVARKKCSNACIGCKKCELNCPQKAITVKDNLAVIDYSKCTACGICVEICPTKCIKSLNL